MGLDNMPNHYPCKTGGTAIMKPRLDVDGNQILDEDGDPMSFIDCEATQKAGGCPYMNEYSKVKGEIGEPVYGMLGTDCWYRGKYGNFLLEEIGLYDETEGLSFYGALGDNTHKSPHECLVLADAIDAFLDDEPDWKSLNGDGDVSDLKYASWYLRWASKHTGGLDCWY